MHCKMQSAPISDYDSASDDEDDCEMDMMQAPARRGMMAQAQAMPQ